MIALALALLLAVADTTETPPDPGRQVITRAEIEAAGLYRLPDLFRLIDGVRTATVDGFTWRTSSAGRPFGAEAWMLLVDGEPVDFALFGEQNLSLVPVAITHVDSVEVWRAPRLVAGRMAHGGVIHLHTSRPERAFAARAGVAIGNEVGDPGPYRYVPERFTPNVDKFGADYEALAGAAGPGWRAQGRFKLLRFYATDPAALARNQAALGGGNPALRLFAPALRLEADALGGMHALSALGGGAHDLWFFQPFGRELPVRRLWGQAGLRGRVPLSPRLGIGYRLGLAENRLDEWSAGALDLDPRWRERTARAGLDGWWQQGPWSAELGGEVRRTEGPEAFTLGALSGAVARTTPRGLVRLDASLAAAGEVAVSAALHARHALRPGSLGAWTLGATAAVTQQLPEEAGRFGFWLERGYDAFAGALGIARFERPGTTTSASFDLDAAGVLGAGVTAEVRAAVRSARGLYLETQRSAPDPDLPPDVIRQTAIEPNAAGEVAEVGFALRGTRGAWRGRLFYDGLAPLGGDEAFERAWEAAPRHRAGASATLAPDPGFSVSGSLAYRSAAYWPAYQGLDGANGGLYSMDIPAVWLLDASVQKRLWQERLRLSLLFRNLLNREERYHPVGAALDLRFYLRVELLL